MTETNPLAFLEGSQPEAPADDVADSLSPEAAWPPEVPEQPRDETGRFASPQAGEGRPEPGHVPLGALMDERDKRKALEAQLAELAALMEPGLEPETSESMFDDEAFAAHLADQQQMMSLQTRMDVYEELARQKHGDQAVDQAWSAACQRARTTPSFIEEVLSARNPIEFAIAWHERESALADIDPGQLAAFRRWQAGQAAASAAGARRAAPSHAAAAAYPQQSMALPTDLVSAPGAASGGAAALPVGPGRAFDALFGT